MQMVSKFVGEGLVYKMQIPRPLIVAPALPYFDGIEGGRE